jgi:signal transduction histidine kinase
LFLGASEGIVAQSRGEWVEMRNSVKSALVGFLVMSIVALAEVLIALVCGAQATLVLAFVVLSQPALVALAMMLMTERLDRWRLPPPSATPVQDLPKLLPPPVPAGIGQSTIPQVEEAKTGRTRTMTEQDAPGSERQVRALSELVKVLKEQAERTAAESRAKSAYLADMSHELRTPLGAIVGYAELLEEEAEEQSLEQAHDLHKIVAAGRQLIGLISNLLDLSKIEVGQLAVVLQDVDMAQVVEEVRVAVAQMDIAPDVSFSTRVSPGARLVLGDHMRIRQVLVNLLRHAFSVTRKGRVSLVVERATPLRDAWIALRVKDTGPGMTPQEATRAFDQYAEFAQRVLQPSRSRPGLELAISRQLAELMGGRIEVESEKGLGSTFSMFLPPSRTSEETIAPRSSLALNERLAGTRILIVDSEAFGLSLQRYLERAGLTPRLVTDAKSGRIAAQSEKPQIVVVDCGLEGSWELIEDLYELGTRIVATSLRDEDVERSLQLGVSAFLVRPIERKMVLATLERCLAPMG